MEKQNDEFTMTELWLVKADWNKTFIGSIKRSTKNGTPHLSGTADINGVTIMAEGKTEEELTDKLDALCIEVLEQKKQSEN